ncbi:MAG: hypothetical protein Q9222_003077 [Ikaeria aurantiellina]
MSFVTPKGKIAEASWGRNDVTECRSHTIGVHHRFVHLPDICVQDVSNVEHRSKDPSTIQGNFQQYSKQTSDSPITPSSSTFIPRTVIMQYTQVIAVTLLGLLGLCVAAPTPKVVALDARHEPTERIFDPDAVDFSKIGDEY